MPKEHTFENLLPFCSDSSLVYGLAGLENLNDFIFNS